MRLLVPACLVCACTLDPSADLERVDLHLEVSGVPTDAAQVELRLERMADGASLALRTMDTPEASFELYYPSLDQGDLKLMGTAYDGSRRALRCVEYAVTIGQGRVDQPVDFERDGRACAPPPGDDGGVDEDDASDESAGGRGGEPPHDEHDSGLGGEGGGGQGGEGGHGGHREPDDDPADDPEEPEEPERREGDERG